MFNFEDTQYDYVDFVSGNPDMKIPEFAVYFIGLFVVDQYLAINRKKASELLLDKAEIFRKI